MKRIVPLVVGLLCLALPATGAAATFAVNTTADGPVVGTCAAGEACTLRDALNAATTGAEKDNVVTVPAGTYDLTAGELAIAAFEGGTVRVVGGGARGTIVDAGGASRVLDTNADTTVLEGLTITGGAANELLGGELPGDGGGILFGTSAEAGTLRGVAVTDNTAMLNGGGIAATPEGAVGKAVTIEDSTIAGNEVSGGAVEALGGGLYVLGELTMVNSTVAENVAESTVGLQEGGGILAGPATTEVATTSTAIVNSTIAENFVGTGGTGGGIFILNPAGGMIEPTSTLTNTIVAYNEAGEAEANCGPLTLTSKNDISSDGTCTFTDVASRSATDPLLGFLADNGGETDTLVLLPGSPAIDTGTTEGCPATDQRGVARPVGAGCDIGAYEFQPTPPAPPSKGGGNSGGGTTSTSAASADLKLTIKAKPKKPKRGKKLAFTVTVANAGPSTAIGATFTATVPKATKKVKVPGLAANACKLVNTAKGKKAKKKAKKRTLTCALGDLPAGRSLTFAIGVRTKKAPRKVAISGAAGSAVADPTRQDAKATAVVKLAG